MPELAGDFFSRARDFDSHTDDFIAIVWVTHKTVRRREAADVAHQSLLVFLAPGFSHGAYGKEKTRNRVGGNSEPLVALLYQNKVFGLSKRHRVAFAFSQESARAGVPTSSLTLKSPSLMPFFAMSLRVEMDIVSTARERPTTLPFRSANVFISGLAIKL